ncbi:MAG: restriction endonuclease subunit S, partial [Spirochaetia bacterium]|nr:restriction endonuclease subunit S [Spirochaetia bacterium]
LKPFGYGVSENGELKGIVTGYVISDGNWIKRYLSRRAIIPGGALLSEGISDEALNLLLDILKKDLKNKVIYIEFRNYNNYNGFKELFTEKGFTYKTHLNFHVATPNPELSMKNLSSTKLMNDMFIPIPPLNIQNRISSLLDKFDSLVNDISIGLPAEIEARRKQYEYYRNKLLSFKRKES